RLQSYYGFTRTPFGRSLAPSMLHRHRCHQEAVARITWCIEQHHIGVITGEVGAGKTVAIRAATAASPRPPPPSASAGSCPTSSPPSAPSPDSTPPPWPAKPPTPWPPKTV